MNSYGIEKERQLREKVKQRVACEERAFRIVEKLVETTVSRDELCNIAGRIDQTHYEDIVEERSISKICGYPICDKPLEKVLQQKYQIMTSTNSVYDITHRKRFCSGQCFKCSEHYLHQIPSSPVWSRLYEKPPKITLLTQSDKFEGGYMENVIKNPKKDVRAAVKQLHKHEKVLHLPDSTHEQKSKEKNDSNTKLRTLHVIRSEYYGYDSSQQELKSKVCSDIQNYNKSSVTVDQKMMEDNICMPETFTSHSETTLIETDTPEILRNASTDYLMDLIDKRQAAKSRLNNVLNSQSRKNVETTKEENSHSSPNVGNLRQQHSNLVQYHSAEEIKDIYEKNSKKTRILQNIQQSQLQNSFTLDSDDDEQECYGGEHKVLEERGVLNPLAEKLKMRTVQSILLEWRTTQTGPFLQGKRKVEKDSDEISDEFTHTTVSSAEEINNSYEFGEDTLENRNFRKKVMKFYGCVNLAEKEQNAVPNINDLRNETKELFITQSTKAGQLHENYDREEYITEKEVQLPYVDLKSKLAVRRKIVLDKLSAALQPFLPQLQLSIRDISQQLRELIFTFNLTNTNILLRPTEWTLVAIFGLFLLANVERIIQDALAKGNTEMYLNTILQYTGISIEEIKLFVTRYVSMK